MFFKEFFYFPKSDRKALVFLLLFIAAVIVGIRVARNLPIAPSSPQKAEERKEKMPFSSREESPEWDFDEEAQPQPQLAPFDPNPADARQLLALGLQRWQVRCLLKYRAKGGVFRQPEDFARLYGLTQKQYRLLEPYIRISADYRPAAELFAGRERKEAYVRDTVKFPVKIKEGMHVLLNSADTSMLKKVPGIGSYFARQIVLYRNRLGGFSQVNQLAEIDDFPIDALPYFQLSTDEMGKIRRLNLNRLTLNELKRHPYINFYMARAIVDYRRLRGPLHSLDDLKLLKEFTPEKIKQLEPYVEF